MVILQTRWLRFTVVRAQHRPPISSVGPWVRLKRGAPGSVGFVWIRRVWWWCIQSWSKSFCHFCLLRCSSSNCWNGLSSEFSNGIRTWWSRGSQGTRSFAACLMYDCFKRIYKKSIWKEGSRHFFRKWCGSTTPKTWYHLWSLCRGDQFAMISRETLRRISSDQGSYRWSWLFLKI